jgi:hypothetical protein
LALIAVNGNSAVVKVTAFVTTPPVSPWFNPSPGGALHAVDLTGWCANNSGSTDASRLFHNHVQTYAASANTGSACTGRMLVILGTFNSSFPGDAQLHGLNHTNVLNNIWKGNSNACIGDDNSVQTNDGIWNSWFSKWTSVITAPLNHYQQYATQPNVSAVLVSGYVDGLSPNNNFNNLSIPGSFSHY